jgi:hypothetical protein
LLANSIEPGQTAGIQMCRITWLYTGAKGLTLSVPSADFKGYNSFFYSAWNKLLSLLLLVNLDLTSKCIHLTVKLLVVGNTEAEAVWDFIYLLWEKLVRYFIKNISFTPDLIVEWWIIMLAFNTKIILPVKLITKYVFKLQEQFILQQFQSNFIMSTTSQ